MMDDSPLPNIGLTGWIKTVSTFWIDDRAGKRHLKMSSKSGYALWIMTSDRGSLYLVLKGTLGITTCIMISVCQHIKEGLQHNLKMTLQCATCDRVRLVKAAIGYFLVYLQLGYRHWHYIIFIVPQSIVAQKFTSKDHLFVTWVGFGSKSKVSSLKLSVWLNSVYKNQHFCIVSRR